MNEEYKICNNCRAKNDMQALKCKICHAPMVGSMVINFQVKKEDKSYVVCKNCNHVNKSDSLRCNSCNAPLVGSMVIDTNFNPVNQPKPESAQIVQKNVSAVSHNTVDISTQNLGLKVCNRCSYPNMAVAKSCVKCNNSLESTQSAASTPDKITEDSNLKAKPNMKATVNPWLLEKEQSSPKFQLFPLGKTGAVSKDKKDYEGQKVELTRINLDPENDTITSSVQAVIYKKDGKWILSNKSKLQTTFVRVDGDFELKDGAILLFGNKCFQFRTDSK
ncbi:MAG: hypothetical protein IPM42_03495 [Saprospiraceae bacterium]|nr:hypothetical protein [Saprospiraceae bacterium]